MRTSLCPSSTISCLLESSLVVGVCQAPLDTEVKMLWLSDLFYFVLALAPAITEAM